MEESLMNGDGDVMRTMMLQKREERGEKFSVLIARNAV
jgi:hypothetical protein